MHFCYFAGDIKWLSLGWKQSIEQDLESESQVYLQLNELEESQMQLTNLLHLE